MEQFLIDEQDCKFWVSEIQEEHNNQSSFLGFFSFFDKPERTVIHVTYVIIEKEIEGAFYKFISQPLKSTEYQLRVMLRSSEQYVRYNPNNPKDYQFSF